MRKHKKKNPKTNRITLITKTMKKMKMLSMMLTTMLLASFMFVSCTKEGPAGLPGKDGTNGEDGINGADGTATCAVCHDNSEKIEAFIGQWGVSDHAIGGHNFENRTTCAPCHTSQGFREVVGTDLTATAEAISNPSNINCYTCHNIHATYTSSDWELRKTGPHKFWLTQETVDLGNSNLCLSCHQPRTSYTIPDVTKPNDMYNVTSSRFGPHYGSQGSTLLGVAYFMVGSGYSNSAHANIDNACVNCHMADAAGYNAGGHTFKMFDAYEEGYNVAGCVACHTAEESELLIEELHTEVAALMEELRVKLEVAGIYNPANGMAKTGEHTNTVAGAYWNWKSVKEDQSLGVHNPKFVKRVLQNSINALP